MVCASLVAGCATGTVTELTRTRVDVGGGIVLALPGAAELGGPVSAVQSAVIRYDDAVFPFDARLAGTAERILFVGLDQLGRRTLTVEWTGERIEATTTPLFPPSVPVRNLLADIAMIYWPPDVIGKSLTGDRVTFRTGQSYRLVLQGDSEVIRIEYVPSQTDRWSGTARYRNNARGYSIEIRSVEVPR